MDDTIYRQAAIDRVLATGYADQIKDNILLILRLLPSAQPECKKGKWINHWIAPREDMLVFKCDQCGKISDGRHNFCPCCGADMRNQP